MGLVVSDVRNGPFEATFSSPNAEIYAGFDLPTDMIQDQKDQKRVNV